MRSGQTSVVEDWLLEPDALLFPSAISSFTYLLYRSRIIAMIARNDLETACGAVNPEVACSAKPKAAAVLAILDFQTDQLYLHVAHDHLRNARQPFL
jgi:hypothetical protein